MSYVYSAVDRIKAPCSYQYTAFEGKPFLEKYAAARDRAIERLRPALPAASADTRIGDERVWGRIICFLASLKALEGYRGELEHLSRGEWAATLPDYDAEPVEDDGGAIRTGNLLALLIRRCVEPSTRDEEAEKWAGRLVQRFEVTKKLYQHYGPELRKGTGSSGEVRLYATFGVLLALLYGGGGSLKYLNCLLKVNDLISSVPERVQETSGASAPACLALISEVAFVEDLLQRKKVRHDNH